MRKSISFLAILAISLLALLAQNHPGLAADAPATAPAANEKAKDLDSYALLSDDFVSRDKDAKDAIFYAYDVKSISAKLKDYGLKFPDNFEFPTGGLFIVVVSDEVKQKFHLMSAVGAKHWLIVDLENDSDAKPPEKADEGKKTSRVILISCPPIKSIKGFSIKTGDGVRHTVESKQVGK